MAAGRESLLMVIREEIRTSAIAGLLDQEFRIKETADPRMTKHALKEAGRTYVTASRS